MDYDQRIATYIPSNNKSFFANLSKNMKQSAKKVVKARTIHMVKVLKFRENLGHGWGKFPRSDLNKPHAHNAWGWSVTKNGYQIKNEHRANDGYAYPRNLIWGTGWSKDVTGGKLTRLVSAGGDKYFSTQMKKGLHPWILRQREIMKQEIKLASGDKTIRGGKLYE